ncbi:MAG: energy transducer TonB [Acidobacteriota bacterium]
MVVPRVPPPPAAPAKPYRLGGGIVPPRPIHQTEPVYPKVAQAGRVQGAVTLEVTISQEGDVTDPRVLKSIPLLDEAAIDAVKQWKYTPATLNGAPVPVIMTVIVTFSLR